MANGRDLTQGAEHTIPYTEDVLQIVHLKHIYIFINQCHPNKVNKIHFEMTFNRSKNVDSTI